MYLNACMVRNTKNQSFNRRNSQILPDDNGESPDFEGMLVAVGKNRDKESFIKLFEHFAPRVKSFLMRGGTDEGKADELAQETMLNVWNKAKSYNPKQAAASTWIFTIARNKKIDFLRKAGRYEFDFAPPPLVDEQTPSPNIKIQRAQEIDALRRAIENLPEEQAMLIQKSFFEDKSHGEIAEETNIPLGTVKSRIRLALEKLRNEEGVKALW